MTSRLRITLTVMTLAVAALAAGPPFVHALVSGTPFTTGTSKERVTGDNHRGGHRGHDGRVATAKLMDASGRRVGRVWMSQRRNGAVLLVARVFNLTPGFHGFHVHTIGRCDPPAFTTAGGHLNPTGAPHASHAGDLPSLLVNRDGTALLATTTDRFSIADLRDADGSAVMVHSGPDNFANIPPRYGTPDQETLNTGDSGTRVACGVVR
jgi:Cu-Zn family superoxide dismutase